MSERVKTGRPEQPEERVTLQNVVDWQKIRSRHDEYAVDEDHMFKHLMKCLGPISTRLEHQDHEEEYDEIPEKRIADLVISAVWLGQALGYDVPALVSNRIWDIGIRPVREELPPEERPNA